MKVEIGPYVNYIGPYQIADVLCFWVKAVPDKYGVPRKPEWIHDFGTWLATDKNGNDSWLTKLCQWINFKRKRKVKVRIDKHDTWNMGETLAYIILPMLKQLKATKHGSPHVDDEDVPEELRSTSAPPKENEYDIDANHHKRWDWVLDEMIWAFEQLHPDNDWEEQYRKGNIDIKFVPCEWDNDGNPILYQMEKGPNDTYKCDYEGIRKHEERIRRGTMLFGKYYQALWD
jgi:hypothetical protein